MDDEVWDWLNGLPGNSINGQLRGLMNSQNPSPSAPAVGDTRLDEILEHVRSIAAVMPDDTIPDSDQMEMIIDVSMQRKIDERASRQSSQNFNPATIPGVQTGTGNLPRPRRESGVERAQREDRERQDRVRALDSIDDPSIDRSGEFVSG